MTEKDIINLVNQFLFIKYGEGNFVSWRAPAFRELRWDIFGVFDLIVAIKDEPPIFIQATTVTNLSHRRKKIKEFFAQHQVFLNRCYIYAWNDRLDEFKIEHVDNYPY